MSFLPRLSRGARPRRFALLIALVLLLPGAELASRLSGITDVPLYLADPDLGYVPAPNQSGAFLVRNDWVFNELSMGTTRFAPDPRCNLLLVGDSIVYGGNPYRQADKLGPQLERRVDCRVWPISAGSWALLNEIAYLELHLEDVARKMNGTVLVLNSGDFGAPSMWTSELTHPTRRPASALLYALQRYGPSWPNTRNEDPAVMPDRDWEAEWGRRLAGLQSRLGSPITIMLYPNREELADPALRARRFERPRGLLREAGITAIVDLADDRRWTGALYRDVIHPTVEGTSVLAEAIADVVAPQREIAATSAVVRQRASTPPADR